MPNPGVAPPFLGRVVMMDSKRPLYSWSNHFWLKSASITTALTDMGSVVTDLQNLLSQDCYIIGYSVSDPTIKGDSLNKIFVPVPGDWASDVLNQGGLAVSPALHPDFSLLCRLNTSDGKGRNFLYLKGIPASVFTATDQYDPGAATGFSANLDTFKATVKSKCNVVYKSREDLSIVVANINDFIDERITKRNGGRPSIGLPVGRRKR